MIYRFTQFINESNNTEPTREDIETIRRVINDDGNRERQDKRLRVMIPLLNAYDLIRLGNAAEDLKRFDIADRFFDAALEKGAVEEPSAVKPDSPVIEREEETQDLHDRHENEGYTFDELTPDAQETALEIYADINIEDDWMETTLEDALAVGLVIVIVDLEIGEETIRARLLNGVTAHDSAKRVIKKHGESALTFAVAKSFIDGTDYEDIEDDEKDNAYVNDLAELYLKMLRSERYHRVSDEGIKGTIIANDYRFDVDGTKFR